MRTWCVRGSTGRTSRAVAGICGSSTSRRGRRLEEAALYEAPFEYVRKKVKPFRSKSKREAYAKNWWLHMEPRPGMRAAIQGLDRIIVTSYVSKHRLFAWLKNDTLADHTAIAFARDDDYFFGVLHSRPHELWARSQGTQLREVESGFRYTPTSTFETFPFPRPTPEQKAEIADAAQRLDSLRQGWLNPPEDTVSPSELKRRTLDQPLQRPSHVAGHRAQETRRGRVRRLRLARRHQRRRNNRPPPRPQSGARGGLVDL